MNLDAPAPGNTERASDAGLERFYLSSLVNNRSEAKLGPPEQPST
jgi:hypothetical protein